MKLLLAYPHQHIVQRPVDPADLKTVDLTKGGDWPDPVVGPCYFNVKEAGEFIASEAKGFDRLFAMCEEAVLPVGYANTSLGLPGVDLELALSITNRYLLRQKIEAVGHDAWNPFWRRLTLTEAQQEDYPWLPIVLKAPSSTSSYGVKVLKEHTQRLDLCVEEVGRQAYPYVDRLKQFGSPVVYMIEQYIEGDQFCVNGVSRNQTEHLFEVVKHQWTGDFITSYQTVKNLKLQDMAQELADSLGLSWCGWNMEFRGQDGEYKLIDLHARLGEDGKGYNEAISGRKDPTITAIDILRG